jgi:hypothetical protein
LEDQVCEFNWFFPLCVAHNVLLNHFFG